MADENQGAGPERLSSDGGPIYVETPPDIETFAGPVAEPWNTATAALFILIPAAWLWFLRGRYRQYPFLVSCLPLLLTGGVGGTLFHGLRKHRAFFLMDVVPIFLLGLTVAVYLWIRLGPRLYHLLGMIALVGFLQVVARGSLPMQWRINVSYASLAFLMLAPILLVMIRTQFRSAGWIYTALAGFGTAWVCRIADIQRPPLLPMGTHWLWHIFGAASTAALIVYIYRIEGLPLRRRDRPAALQVEV